MEPALASMLSSKLQRALCLPATKGLASALRARLHRIWRAPARDCNKESAFMAESAGLGRTRFASFRGPMEPARLAA